MKKQEIYLLYADLIQSRNIKDRKAFDKKLKAAISSLNSRYAKIMVGGIKKWKGLDEVAAIVKTPYAIPEIFAALNDLIRPRQFRMVFVKDIITQKPNAATDIADMDGEVFVKASNLMLHLKSRNIVFGVDTGINAEDMVFENNVLLVHAIQNKWTPLQYNIYQLYKQSMSQKEIAKKLKVTPQFISKSLATIDAPIVLKAETNLQQWLMLTYKNS